MSMLLAEGDFGFWSILPLLFGAIGIGWNWTSAPALVLVSVLIMLMVKRSSPTPAGWDRSDEVVLRVLLPLAIFLYVVAAMRLLSLVRHTVPPDVRRARRPAGRWLRGRWLLPREATTRSAARVPAGEIGLLLSTAPIFLAGAYLVWSLTAGTMPSDWYEGPGTLWRIIMLIWAGAIVLAASWAFLAFFGRTQASAEESLLYLQDQLWSQTRGEQRQINRAIARARLRRQQKEEGA
jgi:hypothetical protein